MKEAPTSRPYVVCNPEAPCCALVICKMFTAGEIKGQRSTGSVGTAFIIGMAVVNHALLRHTTAVVVGWTCRIGAVPVQEWGAVSLSEVSDAAYRYADADRIT